MFSAHPTQGNAYRYQKGMLLALVLASVVVCVPRAYADLESGQSGQAPPPASSAALPSTAPTLGALRSFEGVPRSQRAEMFYARRFGVDHLQVRYTASGSSLQFRYRVLDAEKAKILNDKRANPYLIDRETGNKLAVPTMEKIGTLRQVATPEEGREYWMVFSNPGKLVKPGQRVDVVIGSFRVEGLLVE
jgi:hypothetical protein